MLALISALLLVQPVVPSGDPVASEPACPTENTPDGPLVLCREQNSDRYRIPAVQRKSAAPHKRIAIPRPSPLRTASSRPKNDR